MRTESDDGDDEKRLLLSHARLNLADEATGQRSYRDRE
jgi:hypothetical protein